MFPGGSVLRSSQAYKRQNVREGEGEVGCASLAECPGIALVL